MFLLAGACSLAGIAPGSALAAPAISGNAAGTPTSPLASPVDIVIAVDESASITPAEMTLEQTAARLIALGEFAPTSRVGVLGFGGITNSSQSAVDPVCQMTEVNTPANRQALSDCISQLHKRTPAEGDRTDFIDAINDGVSDLTSTGDTGRPLLLFLLTDGVLDMVGAPNYSGTNAQINKAANQNLLTQTLPDAKTAQVRLWPLGFGPSVNLAELQEIAAGGAQGSCNQALPDATPKAITVASASQIEKRLPQIFANARCDGYVAGESAPVGSGGTADLYVTVPDIATNGSIEVIRQYPQISVTYFDPAGHQVPIPQGSVNGQTFSLGGANGPVEALSVGNPLPGQWRVHLAAGPGVPAGTLVTTSVLWQGVLHSDITVNPSNPRPGQKVTVTVRLQVRGEVISASDLSSVHVSVQVSGQSLAAPITVPLADNGVPPDRQAGDGVYTGTLVIPRSASGLLTAVGDVAAQGVVGDARSSTITVYSSVLAVSGQLTLPASQAVPGGQATGTLQLSNLTGKEHTIRLVPVDTPTGVTITPPTISLPAASGTTSYPVTVHFGRSVPVGPVTGHINAVDVATGEVYAQGTIATTISVPPKATSQWWFWVLVAVGLVILAIAIQLALGSLRRRRDDISMEQIELLLFYGGSRPIDTQVAPDGCGSKLPFSIDHSRPGQPRLELDFGGANEYVARRWRGHTGGIVVFHPGAEPQRLDVQDAPVAMLDDGMALGFRDLKLLDAPEEAAETWPPTDHADTEPTIPRRHWWQIFGADPADPGAPVPDTGPDEALLPDHSKGEQPL
jgi:hypothetical protein